MDTIEFDASKSAIDSVLGSNLKVLSMALLPGSLIDVEGSLIDQPGLVTIIEN